MKRKTHSIDVIFVFVLFGIFAVLSLLLIFIGSDIYTGTLASTEQNLAARTAVSYVTNKIHANDRKNAIEVEEISGIPVLVLKHEGEGSDYRSLIYCYDGAIRELLTMSSLEMDLSYGEKLVEANGMNIQYDSERNSLTFVVEDKDGNKKSAVVALRSGE